MSFVRQLNLPELLKKKSFFLFGPRATGKSYLIRQQLEGKAQVIDLLKAEVLLPLSQNPSELEALIHQKSEGSIVVIDEVQKVPALLDEVHRLIEEKKIRFLLTGSSARKLKRGQANLLAGRAWKAELFPLSSAEISDFNLERYLQYGGLPAVYDSAQPQEELGAYVQTYLKEEILAEGIIRKLPPFSRFLKSAALSNGQIINFTQVGNDAQVSPSTVREYFSVLEDTLIGFSLEPWTASKKRKAIQTAKFYFFDTGVTHMLAGTKTLDRNSNLYGQSFEQFIGMELKAYLSYRRLQETLTFWRSLVGDYEVDFLIGELMAIEVKASQRINPSDLRGLKVLKDEGVFSNFYLVSQDRMEKNVDGIRLVPWNVFLEELWSGKII